MLMMTAFADDDDNYDILQEKQWFVNCRGCDKDYDRDGDDNNDDNDDNDTVWCV